ncbi:hypothetical protein [Oceanisphaera avium]|uniref:Uncharacterized protein n=1 Tax=Oceanisphaera avium TaxID=1903694 RepID=A0A1Y0D184_9GAMM|nr:hypothetical protein [Oceanisphaera avium]ART80987.1 hypothetical protein CBP12_13160 [Oceanisphaera avium]
MEANTVRQMTTPWSGACGLTTGLMVTEVYQDVWTGKLRLSMGMPVQVNTPPLVVYQLQFDHIFGYRVLEGAETLDFMADEDDSDSDIQIYLVTPSRFLIWFHQQSQGVYLDEDIQHYRIASWDYCVDVLAGQVPQILHQQV